MNRSLPPLSVTGRLDRVRVALEATEAEALIVTEPNNIRWCTGFTGSHGVVVVRVDDATLFTDSRYGEQAPAQLAAVGAAVDVVVTAELVQDGAASVAHMSSVALEADHVSWAEHGRWAAALEGELVATENLITELRGVKDEAELARMQRAAEIVDECLAEAQPRPAVGTAERELARFPEDGMLARVSSGPPEQPRGATGPHAARPPPRPSGRRFQLQYIVEPASGLVGRAIDSACELDLVSLRRQPADARANRPDTEQDRADGLPRRAHFTSSLMIVESRSSASSFSLPSGRSSKQRRRLASALR